MQLTLRHDDPKALSTALLVIPCFEDAWKESELFVALDGKLDGVLARVAKDEQFKAKKGQSVALHTHGKLPADRLLLVGVGARKDFHAPDLRAFGARAVKAAQASSSTSTAALLPVLEGQEHERAVQFLAEGMALGAYRFDRYLTGDKKKPLTVEQAHLVVPAELADPARLDAYKRALTRGQIVAQAVQRARDLVNEPAAVCTPAHVAEHAEKLAKEKGLTVEVLGPKECQKLGMGMFLGVAQGSEEPPRLVHLAWVPGKPGGGGVGGKAEGKGKAARPPGRKTIALIGKGVTFDSGGLSLKPTDSMLDMKVDMSGAAAVISAMGALADLGCPHEVHAFTALCENMLSGKAYRLGDVLTSMNGKTVEINNTDAEGRLTLGDAITYAKQQCEPDELYDFATLTGACMVALGPHTAGIMGNDTTAIDRWLDSAKRSGEDMWHLPLPERLKEQLKSEVADMRNTGSRYGGALTAGLFLKEFVGDTTWVHCDLAGPASTEKEHGHVAPGGTGFAVATIVEHLCPRE
jgi:leucyl aminopeptidase